MTELDKRAVSILQGIDEKFYIDVIDPLQIGLGSAVIANDKGVLVNVQGTWMWSASTEEFCIELAEYVKKHSDLDCGLVVHEQGFVPVSCDILGKRPGIPCYVAARFSKEKFDIKTDIEIKKLTHEYDNLVWKTYGFIKDWDWGLSVAKEHIDAGVYGGFKDGECVGFIGTHEEGTMGMLEILPEFRRHGYGEALEQFLANDYIDQNRIPYCHILETNSASLSLQRDMGFWLSEGKRLVWLQDD